MSSEVKGQEQQASSRHQRGLDALACRCGGEGVEQFLFTVVLGLWIGMVSASMTNQNAWR